ncbi:hypothetical protein JCM11491_001930 [Sporobolomyces phaffii]
MTAASQSTFRVQLFALCVAFAHVIHAAPIPAGLPTPLTVSTGLPTPNSPSSSPTASPLAVQQLWPSPLLLTDPSPSPSPSSAPSPSSSPAEPSTVTSIDTELVTVTATQTAEPVTVTQTVLFTSTVTDSDAPTPVAWSTLASNSVASTTESPSSSATTSVVPTSTPTTKASWQVPSDFAGNITQALGTQKWSWGPKNAQLVQSIPSSAYATPSSSTNQAAVAPAQDLSNGPAMQVTFPKGSINPANKNAPTGGVGLYMSPLDLSKASNVSLEYSVFFPADFDFVKGGKLPGLYGGHKGCSGGQDSEECFSTRLMFRTGGKGELYLYAPKGSVQEELCSTPPLSYCDSSYGWSIGRGAWTFERGAWSNIRQEIRLNTPGIADGGVRIFVNNKLVLSSDAVLYRSNLSPATSTSSSPFSALPTAAPQPSESGSTASTPEATSSAVDEGILGGLLGGLADDLGKIIKRAEDGTTLNTPDIFHTMPTVTETVTDRPTQTVFATSTVTTDSSPTTLSSPQAGLLGQVTGDLPLLGDASIADALPILGGNGSILAPKKTKSKLDDNATFQGIMFNTFFGGNDPSWASPTEQNIWFNRISLSVLA